MKNSAEDSGRYSRFLTNHAGFARLRGGEAEHLLFAPDGECALCRRQKSFFHVFGGAFDQVAAARQTELVLNVLAMALDSFDTQI